MGSDPIGGFAGDWDRLSLAFETVIAMPPARRAEFMAVTYGSDPVLTAELESLVSAHEGATAFLEALHGDIVAPALAHLDEQVADNGQASAPAAGIAPGDRIRHFVVHERLGSGGTGRVYRGRDTVLQRDVAIKVLAPAVSGDPVARSRLVREAQAASRLDDPHVCPIHAVEPMADGGLCIVMAYCAGGTLRDRLRQGPIAPKDVERIARQMARGLASAHRAGIVHGDIKPANVGFGEGDSARLLDFGMAVYASDVSAAGRGALAGTVPYLAPELWQGATHDLKTDVWALGITFFEMVTGSRPFAASDAGDVAALRERIATAPLPPLVHADGSAPSPEFARLISAMLSRDPANRPADGAAVLAALDGVTPAARTWSRPDLSAVVLVVAVVLGVVAWLAAPKAPPEASGAAAVEVARTNAPLPTIAVLPFTTRGDRDIEYLREGMVDMLTPAFDATGVLRGIDPNSVLGAAGGTGARGLDSAAAQSLAIRVGASRYVSGSVLVSGAVMSIRATLRTSDGREVGRAQTTVRDTVGLTQGVDDVVRQLLASSLLSPGDTVAGIAAATTTSVRALRAYLDGERDLRDARPAAAMANFQRAVAIDSSFALAWYRLARAARWSEVDSVSDRAGQRAYDLVATLPQRQQALIRAYHDLRVGSAISAERQLSQIVRDYPTDVEAWMLLGEVRFNSNVYTGRPLQESAEAFQQVMGLDPRNREVTVYLMDLAASADRRGQLDTLFSMYFSPNSAGEQPGIRSAYIALHRRRVVAAANGDVFSDPEAARVTLQRISGDSRDRRAARAAADLLAAEPGTRADGMRALALLDVAGGDWNAAAARFRGIEATDAQRGLEDRALFALAPSITLSPDTVRVIRDELRQRRWLRSVSDDGLTDVERDGLRQYLIGLLSVRLGDAAGVDAAVRALVDARAGSSRVAAPLAAALRGHWASSRGDHAGAATAFAQSITDVPTRLRVRHSVLGQHLDRLARARALQALGDTAASGRWYRSLREGAGVTGLPFSAAADSGLRAMVPRSR